MEVVKEIEDVPTTADKPDSDVIIVDCGELAAEDAGEDAPAAPAAEEEKPETD